MQKIILTLLFQSVLFVRGQNLIQNPGFEELACDPGKGHIPVYCSKHWFCSNFSGTDYYIRVKGVGEGVPKNMHGIQAPHSGNAYAGICIHRDYIEYAGAKLAKPLIAGKNYVIEFYICRAEKSVSAVKEFGILFTEKPFKTIDKRGFVVEPSVKFMDANGFKEEKEWTKLSATYMAEGFESYLTLGHFIYDKPEGVRQFSHYYIDDVSITLIDEDEEQRSKDSIIVPGEPELTIPVFSPKVNESITLENVFFATNKSDLMPESYQELDKLTHYLEKETDTDITINGYTDNIGGEAKNKNLSYERAKAVADYFISKGISTSRIKYNGFGSERPVASNEFEEGRQKNRRVEFTISKK